MGCGGLKKLTFKGLPPEGVVDALGWIPADLRIDYPLERKDQWLPVLVDLGLADPTGADAGTGAADKDASLSVAPTETKLCADAGTGAAERMNRAGFWLLESVAHRRQGENALVSPYSIDSAFTLAWLGAQGGTAEQIKQTLGLPDKPGEVMGRLDLALSGSRRAQVLTSNSIWLDQKRELLGDYEAAVRKDFRMGLFKSDFGDAAGTAGKVNALIDRKTKGMIKNALSPSAITSDTELLLVNTLYFKGKWAKPFEKDNTHKEDFTLSSDAKVKVDMMYDWRDARYAEHDGTKAILLPYEGGRFGFVAILPPKGVPAEALLKGLSDDGVAKWVAAMRTEDTKIWLPKLDFEFREGLVETLKAAGMEVPFTNDADFKRMTGRPLKISEVIHVTKLRMDEIETEAAAATVICSECTASPFQPPPPKEFHADHPYVGVIYDTATRLALFVGVVNDPSRR